MFDINPTPYETDFALPFIPGFASKESIVKSAQLFYLDEVRANEIFNYIASTLLNGLTVQAKKHKEIRKELEVVLKISTSRIK